MKQEEITLHTKQALADSLKKAMKKKPFSKITVSELVADCNINRKTFYYHFENIYELLKWMFEKEAIHVVQHFNLLVDYEEAIQFIMDYIEQNEHIINCAYDSIGRSEMKRFFYNDFYEVTAAVINQAEERSGKKIDEQFKNFTIRFYLEAFTGMLIDWVKNRENQNREEMIHYMTHFLKITISAILSDV